MPSVQRRWSVANLVSRVCREVLEGATELRLMLCREKRTGTRVGTSVIAACGAPGALCIHVHEVTSERLQHPCWCAERCNVSFGAGIFVNDILDAVPIDKYFELFKPGAGGEGGYIRISINFVKDLKDLDKSTGAELLHRAKEGWRNWRCWHGQSCCSSCTLLGVVSIAPVPVQ